MNSEMCISNHLQSVYWAPCGSKQREERERKEINILHNSLQSDEFFRV